MPGVSGSVSESAVTAEGLEQPESDQRFAQVTSSQYPLLLLQKIHALKLTLLSLRKHRQRSAHSSAVFAVASRIKFFPSSYPPSCLFSSPSLLSPRAFLANRWVHRLQQLVSLFKRILAYLLLSSLSILSSLFMTSARGFGCMFVKAWQGKVRDKCFVASATKSEDERRSTSAYPATRRGKTT